MGRWNRVSIIEKDMFFLLSFFSCILVLGVYLVNSAFARRFSKIHLKEVLRYISAVMLLGVFAEVFIDSVYSKLFGAPL